MLCVYVRIYFIDLIICQKWPGGIFVEASAKKNKNVLMIFQELTKKMVAARQAGDKSADKKPTKSSGGGGGGGCLVL